MIAIGERNRAQGDGGLLDVRCATNPQLTASAGRLAGDEEDARIS
jgi:hypothetical protein